jgi:tetratricopeptide (TPR) repeat protein
MHGKFIDVPFWEALKTNIRGQKVVLSMFLNKYVILHGDQPLWVLSLFGLVPLLLIAIRWPSYFGDTSKVGVGIATSILNLLCAVFLLICIWVSFDPPPSPRNYHQGLPPLLTFYYLSALCVGYFAGYFLLVCGKPPSRPRRISSLLRTVNRIVVGVVCLLLPLSLAVLIDRNLPQIRMTNGHSLQKFASLMNQGLPQGAVVLSDDPRRTVLLRAANSQKNEGKSYVYVDTGSLRWPQYHHYLKSVNGASWPLDPPRKSPKISDNEILDLIWRITASNTVYYLHPSFGYYFELLYQQPHGLVYKLASYPTNVLLLPPLSREVADENEAFWARVKSEDLKPLLHELNHSAGHSGFLPTLTDRIHLKPIVNQDLALLGSLYSRALDYWGVEMQKQHRLAEAAQHFESALELNADNIVAQVNLDCNKGLQSGQKPAPSISKSIEDQFGKYRNWEEVLNENGPFDEPNFCFEQGKLHARFQLYRQAASQFARAVELAPGHLPARLWLAQLYITSYMPDDALKLVDDIHSHSHTFSIHKTNQTELLFVEASAYLAKNDLQGAQNAVQSVLQKHPDDEDLLGTAAHVYTLYGQHSNALSLIERHLKITPDDPNLLVNKGYAYIQLNLFEDAIAPLTRALALETNNSSALLNRAIAYLRAEKFADAQRDYETLQKLFPTAFQVYYGLGEIAYRKKDTNAAVRNYQLYLTNSPPNTEESKLVRSRLKELNGSSP